MKALNAETNLKEILRYLRFSKDEGAMYQNYLRHYLPLLPKENLGEFIDDVVDSKGDTDKEFADSLYEKFKEKKEEVIVKDPPVIEGTETTIVPTTETTIVPVTKTTIVSTEDVEAAAAKKAATSAKRAATMAANRALKTK